MKKIYKYFSAEVMSLVFQRDGFAGIKCSRPDQYNDPYELFLGVDTGVSPDLLAIYSEIVEELPQFPTTCFSRSPSVTPMWAHYAANHSGFVMEFDVDALERAFPDIKLKDVEYKDAPNGSIELCLQRVAVTKKPRHAYWLTQAVLSEAYFSKQTSWAYEQECRLVDFNVHVEDVSGSKILFVPINCISSVIFGRNLRAEIRGSARSLVESKDIVWFSEVIGKAQSTPFFVSKRGEVFGFHDGQIRKENYICASCSEPVAQGVEYCSWCAITETNRMDAAGSNPFRVLDHYGLLDDYLHEVGKIGKKRNRKL